MRQNVNHQPKRYVKKNLNDLHPLCVEILNGAQPTFDDLYEAFVNQIDLLSDLKTTPQDPEWHAEDDVHTHSSMTLNALY